MKISDAKYAVLWEYIHDDRINPADRVLQEASRLTTDDDRDGDGDGQIAALWTHLEHARAYAKRQDTRHKGIHHFVVRVTYVPGPRV